MAVRAVQSGGRAPVKGYIGNTDQDWFEFLRGRQIREGSTSSAAS